MQELRVDVPPRYHRITPPSHEWYDPRTGRYRVEFRLAGRDIVRVYDGVTLTERIGRRLIRTSGERRFVRIAARIFTPFQGPGVIAVDPPPSMKWVKREQDRDEVRVVWRFGTDTGETDVPYRVRIIRRDASTDVFDDPPAGRLAGELHQREPGARPRTSVHAYWFGPRLGPARAVTALERWGGTFFEPGAGDPPRLTTVYRLPASALPPHERDERPPYPGLGSQTTEVHVECGTERRAHYAESFAPGTSRRPVRIAGGRRATLVVTGFVLSGRRGVHAVFLIGRTACWVGGLVSPEVVRRAAPTLRPVGSR